MDQPEFGEPVRVRFRKWDGSPHWRTSMAYLGVDEHGHWLGSHPGVQVSRPGAAFRGTATTARLIPHTGCFVANLNLPPAKITGYIDITTPPEFGRDEDGWVLGAVDLDLDVVRSADGRVWIDDEDEFVDHAVRYGYPADVITRTRATADEVLGAVLAGAEPFGTEWRRWTERLQQLPADRG
ncbi:DUF402 domain-containing protein [Microlunatus speluncae]|uniref:DUF402 domain-containing protein n=1 Tax=Microlunatus speluncae TaxID=2594267 RepID=UPI0012665714|nr:DUF402 domain-containing protein [Microlunatus speluncae]